MCGIVGIVHLEGPERIDETEVRRMLAMIRHRGPDEFGIYIDDQAGVGSARLSIIDLESGQQPIGNEDGTLWIVFNGEIFNYLELRPELEALGHRFKTSSDTEVLLHAYEEWGPSCLKQLNGQFACAIWNCRDRSLFLARDRLGVRPLFYSLSHGALVFGSEIKAIFGSGRISIELDPASLPQIFTYWSPLSPHAAFRKVIEIPPGHFLFAKDGTVTVASYWDLHFEEITKQDNKPVEEQLEMFRDLLIDAVQIRLRADVPVGAYLSGGLDSSIIASIIRNFTGIRLDTFSIAFDDPRFDESTFQRRMAQFLGTEHQVVQVSYDDIAKVFPDVIWHAEVPIVRTAPAPMFLLSKLVHQSGYKVVLTGEGADEFLGGYDIFKEMKIRRFWAGQPDSRRRSTLLKRLYPDIGPLSRNSTALTAAFFRQNLEALNSPEYSHAVRWRNGRRNCRFLSQEVIEACPREPGIEHLLPPDFNRWAPLQRAQFLEIKIFLSQYLLSSQGDRMGMAHSIEGRFPFLDYRLVDFCNRLPPNLKLHGLTEKYLLKKLGKTWLPEEINQRRKRPYRAPIHRSFFSGHSPDYVAELLATEQIKHTRYFKPQAVELLVQKIKRGDEVSESDDMALAGILSTQLLHHLFVDDFHHAPPLLAADRVKICRPLPAAVSL